MNRAFGCSTNPLRSAGALNARAGHARINLTGRLGFALALLVAGVSSYAQTPDSLPLAPDSQRTPWPFFFRAAPFQLPLPPAQDAPGKNAPDMSRVGREPQDAPVTAMFSRED